MIEQKMFPFTYCFPDNPEVEDMHAIEDEIWRCIMFAKRPTVDSWVATLAPYIDAGEVMQAKYYSGFRGNPSALIVYSYESRNGGLAQLLDMEGVGQRRFWEPQTKMRFLDRKLATIARSIIGV